MEIIVAKLSGFCYGVARAVNTVYKNLGENLCTYGQIIHNKTVTEDLEQKGIRIIDNLDGVTEETVIIRAHGIPKSVYEELQHKGIKFIDCTCKDVKRIHEIVEKNHSDGKRIIIVGSKKHPEIIGISGFCENPLIIESPEDIDNADFAEKIDKSKSYALVVQTTFVREVFEKIIGEINNFNLDINIYDTICSSTANRLKEAEEISKKVTKMIVIGDKTSANSTELYNICKKNCNNTFFIESIRDLQLNIFASNDKIGITAGASTPPAIIEEAVNIMSELENAKSNESFEEMLNKTLLTLHTGDVVKGTVISVTNGEVSVNLGFKSDGIVTRAEFSDDPTIVPEKVVKPGDEITVFVIRVNDGEGNVLLSKKKVDSQKNLAEIEQAFNDKTPIKGKIVDVVKGGLMAVINGVKIFVPSSQVSNRYVENLSSLKGKEFNFNILEFDRVKSRVIAGRKELAAKEQTEKREKVFSSLEIGQKVDGVVSRIVEFGAFVDLGGVDGLIHISELSWGRVKKVSDVLKENDKVSVSVLDIDKAKGKISLSLKDITNDPWHSVEEKYPIGTAVEGKVVRMVSFGAFVELEPGIDGLVHISQIADKHVVTPENELSIGEIIKVKVTELDIEHKKISLSKKAVDGVMAEKGEPELSETIEINDSVVAEIETKTEVTLEVSADDAAADKE